MATQNDTTVPTKEALAAWNSVYNAREELNGLIDAFPDFNLHERRDFPVSRLCKNSAADRIGSSRQQTGSFTPILAKTGNPANDLEADISRLLRKSGFEYVIYLT